MAPSASTFPAAAGDRFRVGRLRDRKESPPRAAPGADRLHGERCELVHRDAPAGATASTGRHMSATAGSQRTTRTSARDTAGRLPAATPAASCAISLQSERECTSSPPPASLAGRPMSISTTTHVKWHLVKRDCGDDYGRLWRRLGEVLETTSLRSRVSGSACVQLPVCACRLCSGRAQTPAQFWRSGGSSGGGGGGGVHTWRRVVNGLSA